MSVLFKAVRKSQPGLAGGGNYKFYASIVRQQPVELRKFANEIASRCTLTTTDVYAVLESFLERMHTYMEEGRIIRLGDFGSFTPFLSSNGEVTPEDITKHSISKMRISFRPGMELHDRLSRIKYLKTGTATDSSEIVE